MNINNMVTDLVGSRLEAMVHETFINSMAELSHVYFLKIVPNLASDSFDTSEIVVPPSRLQRTSSFPERS